MTGAVPGLVAAVDLAPWIGVPLATVGLVLLAWHHARLGRPGVPAPRRRIRRAATWTMAAGVVAITVALCFADPAVRPGLFVAAWATVMTLLLVVILLAMLDLAVSSWLIRLEHDEAAIRRGAAVLAALEEEAARRGGAAGSGPGDSAAPPDDPRDPGR